jgi:pilus assembly protein CpaB
MARKRIFTVLLIAMTVGAMFALGTYRYVQAMPSAGVKSVQTATVVVAASNMDVGTALRAEDLRAIEWPSKSVPEGAFHKPEELVGRGLIQPVVAFEPILPAKLASPEAGAGLPPVIPEGMRALSVRVNDVIGVAGYVLPGTRVDVLVTVSPTEQHNDITSKLILPNVQVLTAGTRIERDVEKDKPVSVSVVTLLVDPEQAERLTLASTEGKIQLALRNPMDKTAPETRGVKPAVLLASAAAAARPAAPARRASGGVRKVTAAAPSAPAPEPSPVVEIIRGDKRAQEVVRQE